MNQLVDGKWVYGSVGAAEGEGLLRAALATQLRSLPAHHPHVEETRVALGGLLRAGGRAAEAMIYGDEGRER